MSLGLTSADLRDLADVLDDLEATHAKTGITLGSYTSVSLQKPDWPFALEVDQHEGKYTLRVESGS